MHSGLRSTPIRLAMLIGPAEEQPLVEVGAVQIYKMTVN